MRNQNLGKYFNGDTAVLTWEISGATQLPLGGQPHAGRNINNLRYADDTTLMAESEEQVKSLLMRVKERKS